MTHVELRRVVELVGAEDRRAVVAVLLAFADVTGDPEWAQGAAYVEGLLDGWQSCAADLRRAGVIPDDPGGGA